MQSDIRDAWFHFVPSLHQEAGQGPRQQGMVESPDIFVEEPGHRPAANPTAFGYASALKARAGG